MTDDPIEVDYTDSPLYASTFDQAYPVDTNSTAYAPVVAPGMIIMWYGTSADVPEGWALCQQADGSPATYDGTNQIPDLMARYVVGRGSDTVSPYSGPAARLGLSGTANTTSAPSHQHRFPSTWTSTMVVFHGLTGTKKTVVDDHKDYVDHSSVKTGSGGQHHHSISDWSALDSKFTNGGDTQTAFTPPTYGLFFLIKLA